MQTIAVRLLAVVLVAALAGWGGYSHGRKIERADWLQTFAQQQADADIKARANAEAESRRATEAQAERDRLAQQIARLNRNAKRAAVPVTECRISAAEQRLLDDELAAYRAATPSATGAVQDPVPIDAGAGRPGYDLAGGSERPARLGLRLPAEAVGVHRVD